MLLLGDWVPADKEVSIAFEVQGHCLLNLEAPILQNLNAYVPLPKAGPRLSSTRVPQLGGDTVVCLANNHIMDYGEAGLRDTCQILHSSGSLFCGAGDDTRNAQQPVLLQDRGIHVGIISCCEAQFGVARHNSPGVAEFGPWVYEAIRSLNQQGAAVIISIHAAVEESPWPYPYLQELYRSYIDAGATVVHGHHAHVPQGFEEYGGGLILYGLGNFAVDPDKWHAYPNGLWSLGAEIDLSISPVRWQLRTFEIRYTLGSNTIRIEESSRGEHAEHLDYFARCNYPLSNSEFLAAMWQEVALRTYHRHGANYMGFGTPPLAQSGKNRFALRRRLTTIRNALLNYPKDLPTKVNQHQHLLWYHMIACESHRQMLSTALGVLSGEIPDLRTPETQQLADRMMPWSIETA